MTRRGMLFGVGAAFGAVPLLAACGAGNTGNTAPATSSQPATVTFISRTAEQEAFTKRLTEFREKFPNTKVEYQPLPGDYPAVIRTNAAAGTLADVLYLQNLVFEGLALSNAIQPIDKLVQRDKLNLKQWYDNGINSLKMEGKLFGLPARGQIQNCYVFYNRDLFAQAGLREPSDTWTQDDMVAAAEKLTVRDGSRFGYATSWGTFQHAVSSIRRFGGEVLSPDGKKSLVDSPQALAAMQWHHEMWHRRQAMAPKPAAAVDFGSGAIAMSAMQLAGARGEYRTAVKDGFKWSMIMMPKGPTGRLGADLSVAPISLNTKATSPDHSWEVVKWFTDKETGVQLALQQASNTPGMRPDVYCDQRLLSDPNFPKEVMERPCKAMEQTSSTVVYSVPWNFRQPAVNEVIGKYLTGFRENTMTPSAAVMQQFSTELQAVLDQPR